MVLALAVTTVTLTTVVAALLLPSLTNLTKKKDPPSTMQPKTKRLTRTGPICPFTKDTNFIVECAASVPIAPLEQGGRFVGPNAARWLAYGLSGQDTPGKLRAGLKRLRDTTYFLVQDDNFATELALKEKNLNERRDICFVMEKTSVPAQREVLDLFLHYLPKRYPEIYTVDSSCQTITVRLGSNVTKTFLVSDYQRAPLELCERIVQEDLILMRPEHGADMDGIHSYHMAAAAVVFSFRDLAHKLSQPAEFIHAPVPHFKDHIQKSLNLLFSKLSSDKPLWRNNWGIAGTGSLDEPLYGSVTAHEERRMATVTLAEVKQKYLKVEYQTIRRLPTSGYLLFTVKTMVNRLDELEQVPTAAACLASSIRGMSEKMHRYKGIDDNITCDAVLQYLDTIASSASSA
jgi:dimethylamine monooxygenase subunit A